MINWRQAQTRLGVVADGKPGPRTYDALCARIAGRKPEDVDDRVAIGCAEFVPQYGQDATPERLAEFLAQCCNETGGWRAWIENLNYSAAGLRRTWPSRFNTAQAVAAAGNPYRIAVLAYGGRMGNGAAPSLDGWNYRGRGALQLTGRTNYARFGSVLGLDLLDYPDLAAQPDVSVRIALEFFKQGKVNGAIDRGDYAAARRITNGGYIGLEHVANLRARALAVLA